MIGIDFPNDIWFIVAGWGIILGGLALYALTLVRRLAAARRAVGDEPPPDEERG